MRLVIGRIENISGEDWRYIDEGKRRINKKGVVISCKTNKEQKIRINHKGYGIVRLSYGWYPIHKILGYCFLFRSSTLENTIDHINGNKNDNSLNNLQWVTNKENIKRSWDIGLREGQRIKISKFNSNKSLSKETKDKISISNKKYSCELPSDFIYDRKIKNYRKKIESIKKEYFCSICNSKIKRRTKLCKECRDKKKERICTYCNKHFTSNDINKGKFCSKSCSISFNNTINKTKIDRKKLFELYEIYKNYTYVAKELNISVAAVSLIVRGLK